MRTSGPHQPARWIARFFGTGIASAVVVVVLAACGTRADASCGDWLEGHAMGGHPVAGHVAAAAEASSPMAGVVALADRDTPRPPRSRPCNGPACRRAPVLPLAPGESPTVPLDHERDALAAVSRVLPAFVAVALSGADAAFFSSALSSRLDRPPRHG